MPLYDTNPHGTSTFAKPAYLTPVYEPDFATKLIRITGDVGTPIPTVGGNWSNLTHHQYSKSQAWNADQTLLYLSEMGGALGPGVQLFLDGVTYAPLFSGNHPGPDARWHPTIATVMICNTATGGIVHWNPVTNITTPKFTTTNYNNAFLGNYESQPSNDGRWIAVNAIRNSDGKAVMYAVDIDTGVKTVDIDLVANGITTLDFCTVSPSGNYLLAFGVIDGVDQRIKIFLKNGSLVQYWNDLLFGHLDLAYDVDGNEVVFGSAGSSHQFLMRRISDGVITYLTGAWTSFNWHASCRNINRPGWGYACVNDDTGYLLDLEVVAIKLSAANQIERFGRHRTNDIDFDSAALVSPSPDGRKILFSSNWGDASGRPVQTYLFDVNATILEASADLVGSDSFLAELSVGTEELSANLQGNATLAAEITPATIFETDLIELLGIASLIADGGIGNGLQLVLDAAADLQGSDSLVADGSVADAEIEEPEPLGPCAVEYTIDPCICAKLE